MYDFSDYVDLEQDYETAERLGFETLEEFYYYMDKERKVG